MLARTMQTTLINLMRQFAIVTIIGPRQSGKTTIVKNTYPNKAYFNLEEPDTRSLIASDPKQFFLNLDLQKGVILDEIQRIPELLSYIQVIVDENRIPGSFILTGSQQLNLNAAISQSLAGRTALLELLPLTIEELNSNNISYTVDEYLVNGFFPAIYQHNLDAIVNSRNYIKTYLERDVRQITNIKDLNTFQRFIKLSAGRIGSTINRESLANDVGVSQNTIKNWLSLLEAQYIIFQLPPYYENFGKRIIKAAKLYFCDIGLASYLLDIRSKEQMNYDKMRGSLFENLVIIELLKYKYNLGQDSNSYFYRDSRNIEIDVILQKQNQLIPIEIKSSATFNASFLKNIKYFQKLVGDRAPVGFIIYTGSNEQQIGNIKIINYKNLHEIFKV